MGGDDAAERLRLAEDRAAAAERAVAERDAMLRELVHRMRNSMQLAGSLVQLQASALPDPEAALRFSETAGRIRAIGLAMEHPARPGDMSAVELGGYLRAVLHAATGLYSPRNVTVGFQADAAELAMQRAVPLGLVINEALSNALRHAFPGGRGGSLRLTARRGGDGMLTIIVADDGVGLPADLEPERARTLGLRLVRRLARQAGADMTIERDNGTRLRLTLAADAASA